MAILRAKPDKALERELDAKIIKWDETGLEAITYFDVSLPQSVPSGVYPLSPLPPPPLPTGARLKVAEFDRNSTMSDVFFKFFPSGMFSGP